MELRSREEVARWHRVSPYLVSRLVSKAKKERADMGTKRAKKKALLDKVDLIKTEAQTMYHQRKSISNCKMIQVKVKEEHGEEVALPMIRKVLR